MKTNLKEIQLIKSVLKGYPSSIVKNDALRALRSLQDDSINAARYKKLRDNCSPTKKRKYFSVSVNDLGQHIECENFVDNHWTLFSPKDLDRELDKL